MFTKQHYEQIAEIISRQSYDVGDELRLPAEVGDIARDLAEFFERDNPRFDEDKFLDTCWGKK